MSREINDLWLVELCEARWLAGRRMRMAMADRAAVRGAKSSDGAVWSPQAIARVEDRSSRGGNGSVWKLPGLSTRS